ncbi:XkdW family protein [Paenibacillus glufosinatiresistens]|uniref:XkdW family protein n=1 Tax=Paenibacillus glufosinatiresistens TaxID=3070657 RepID=UPI00286E4803|nr:XkdW family protein [Paenibacillus sp. YX.27]
MHLSSAIQHLYPKANPFRDFLVQDDTDGRGPYIAYWGLDAPQPTDEELQHAWDEYQKSNDFSAKPESLEQRIQILEQQNASLLLLMSEIQGDKRKKSNVLMSFWGSGKK